jgi:lantibiotic biosynthesis protein
MDQLFNAYSKLFVRSPAYPLWMIDELSEQQLLKLLDDTFFKEALWLASPVLYGEAQKWKNGLLEQKQIRKLLYSLTKYYQRMCTRVTPFGLFAGCSTLAIDQVEATDINMKRSPVHRYSRLDMDFLFCLIQYIEKDYDIRKKLRYKKNSTIYAIGDQYRYVEYVYVNNRRKYTITAVDKNEYLDKLIEKCSIDRLDYSMLLQLLTDDEISEEEAEQYIHQLIDSQLIVTNLEMELAGDDALVRLIRKLNKIKCDKLMPLIDLLEEIQQKLISLDKNGMNEIHQYESIIDKINNLGINYSIEKLFQVDFVAPIDDKSRFEKKDIEDILAILGPLSAFSKENPNFKLKRFIEKYKERYDTEEVQLVQVLDTDIGIGYPVDHDRTNTPFVDDFRVHMAKKTDNTTIDNIDSYLLSLITNAYSEKKQSIELNINEFAEMASQRWNEKLLNDLQPSMNIIFQVVDCNQEKKILFEVASGTSSIDIIGRFGHTKDTIHESIKEIAQHESNINANFIMADIVHLPEARHGNIICKPQIYDYQIPFMAKASVDNEHVIDITDLFISINSNGNIMLRSKKINKYIIPRLNNSHNFSYNSLPVYHFLSEIQNQSRLRYIKFHWGTWSNYFKFFPRVTCGKFVLSLASWRVYNQDLKTIVDLYNKSIDFNIIKSAVDDWRSNNSIPEMFLLVEGDNELHVNTANKLSLLTFIDEVKNKQSFIIEEFLSPYHGNKLQENYVKQFALPILRRKADFVPEVKESINSPIRRKISPGNNVLYIKIYGGASIVEKNVLLRLHQLIEILAVDIDKWFFIRYNDPHDHIRLRFFLKRAQDASKICIDINTLLQPLMDSNILWKVEIDTYVRELERYTPQFMELSESLFYHDSKCALEVLNAIYQSDNLEQYRWMSALINIDMLLTDMGMEDLEEKYKLVSRIRNSFFNEFGGSLDLNRTLSDKYRSHRKLIEIALIAALENETAFNLNNIFKNRSKYIIAIIDEIKTSGGDKKIEELAVSYIHMTLNRLFLAQPRKHELIIYDFLERFYKSRIAMQK